MKDETSDPVACTAPSVRDVAHPLTCLRVSEYLQDVAAMPDVCIFTVSDVAVVVTLEIVGAAKGAATAAGAENPT